MQRLLDLLLHVGKFAETERLASGALPLSRRALGDRHPTTLALILELGWALEGRGRPVEAEALFREAWEGYAVQGPAGLQTLRAMKSVADALAAQGRLEEAEAHYVRTLDAALAALGENHSWVAAWIASLGECRRRLGRLEEAEADSRRALDVRRRIIGPEHAETLFNMHALAMILRDRGRPEEASRLWQDATETGQRVLGPGNYYMAIFKSSHGELLADAGRYEEAERLLGEAHAAFSELLGAGDERAVATLRRLIDLHDVRGRPQQAAAARAMLPPGPTPDEEARARGAGSP
jgi:tetratricopeptide (TPR) repeat protein